MMCPRCEGFGGWWTEYEGYEKEELCDDCNGTGETDDEED